MGTTWFREKKIEKKGRNGNDFLLLALTTSIRCSFFGAFLALIKCRQPSFHCLFPTRRNECWIPPPPTSSSSRWLPVLLFLLFFFCVFLLCLDLLFPSVSLRIHQAARVVVLHQQVLLTGHWMEFILGLIDSVLEFLNNLFMSAFFNYEAWFWNWLSLAPIQQFFLKHQEEISHVLLELINK